MRKLILAILMLGVCSFAGAEGVGELLNKFPVKQGYFFDVNSGKGYSITGVEIIQKAGFSGNLAYVAPDAAAVTLDFSLAKLPTENVPVIRYLEYFNIGYGVGYKTVTLFETEGNPDSDNKLIHGPLAYFKIKF